MLFHFILLSSIIKIAFFNPHCKVDLNNCSICNPLTHLCTKCSHDIYIPNKDGGCSPISKCFLGKNYCLECDENDKNCKSCEIGLYPDENGGCSFINNCEISYKGYCLKCKQDFILIGTICKSIYLEDFLNCEKINNLTGLCEKCQKGYFLNEGDNKCTSYENCYESIFGKCISCKRGYYLDIKENKCIKPNFDNEALLFCKESLDGKKCDKCEEDYFFDDKGNCTHVNYCAERKEYSCIKCKDGYFFNKYRDTCISTQNCTLGDPLHGLCRLCDYDYYLDLNDGKCKLRSTNIDYKNCEKVENNECISCNFPNQLSEDGKCTYTKNCSEVYNGTCLACSEGYFLGKDNRCIDVAHCIYSEEFYECKECEDGYYYNVTNKTCLKFKKDYENCRITSFNGDYCSFCKSGFYVNQSDHLCYSNEEKNNLYKCILYDETEKKCLKCEKDYHIGIIDKKCNNIEYCENSEDGNKCLQCDKSHCLDINKGICQINYKVLSEDNKFYYRCNQTNEKGNECQICNEGYDLNNGLCVENKNCVEKNEDGNCIKCNGDDENSYCLNEYFGCIKVYDDKCIECNNIFDFDKCTKCKEGYKLNEINECIES